MKKKVQVKILNSKINQDIKIPTYATKGSAAMDLRACIDNKIELLSKNTTLIFGFLNFLSERIDIFSSVLPFDKINIWKSLKLFSKKL